MKDRKNDKLLWGDEIEYMILKFDHSKKKVYIALRAKEVIGTLEAEETELEKLGKVYDCLEARIRQLDGRSCSQKALWRPNQ